MADQGCELQQSVETNLRNKLEVDRKQPRDMSHGKDILVSKLTDLDQMKRLLEELFSGR